MILGGPLPLGIFCDSLNLWFNDFCSKPTGSHPFSPGLQSLADQQSRAECHRDATAATQEQGTGCQHLLSAHKCLLEGWMGGVGRNEGHKQTELGGSLSSPSLIGPGCLFQPSLWTSGFFLSCTQCTFHGILHSPKQEAKKIPGRLWNISWR